MPKILAFLQESLQNILHVGYKMNNKFGKLSTKPVWPKQSRAELIGKQAGIDSWPRLGTHTFLQRSEMGLRWLNTVSR
jgi:hypothetical protein